MSYTWNKYMIPGMTMRNRERSSGSIAMTTPSQGLGSPPLRGEECDVYGGQWRGVHRACGRTGGSVGNWSWPGSPLMASLAGAESIDGSLMVS